jgi:hypothetical protein
MNARQFSVKFMPHFISYFYRTASDAGAAIRKRAVEWHPDYISSWQYSRPAHTFTVLGDPTPESFGVTQ